MPIADSQPGVRVTAGLRGAIWDPEKMSRQYSARIIPATTRDGQSVHGVLYQRQETDRVAVIMHPREFVMSHYLVPYVLDAGWACWVQGARTIGNDLRLEHELALLDVAAGLKQLKDSGFKTIVLIGNSGGAGLFAFYNQQSRLDAQARLAVSASGRPVKLQDAIMPTVDGMALVSPHPGQGCLLMNCIDPSVTDESDPFSVDAALDPFAAENGFVAPPESSSYSDDFIVKYRSAQRDRVAKIDRHARGLIARRLDARQKIKSGKGTARDSHLAAYSPVFEVWRTDADLRCWDCSIDPSDRLVGSLWGSDPHVSNLGSVGFGRIVTPESWLSTWSGLSSNASMEKCADSIVQPTLIVEYTGDNCVFPEELESLAAMIPAASKEMVRARGNHHGQPIAGKGQPGQEVAGTALTHWLGDTRF